MAITDLPAVLRAKAEQLRADAAAEQAARAYERAAELLEAELRGSQDEILDLDRAEEESGYSRMHLRRMLRDRVIPNAGKKGRPLILRRDLPRKPGYQVATHPRLAASSEVQLARAVANGGR